MEEGKKVLVILGTVREDSNTLKALHEHGTFPDAEICDLHKLRIEQFRYESHPQDDFMTVVNRMAEMDCIVFATPVYSSAMSTMMKIFFDRLSALGQSDPTLRNSLSGKKTYVFATGNHEGLPEGFEVPFRETSSFLGMTFEQSFYYKMD